MAHSASLPGGALAAVEERVHAARTSIPWYVWCLVIGTTSAVVGGIWDISWHKSIGRDSFWTPAHLLIYLCGVTAGVGSAWMIFDATFRTASPLREASVRMWGFRGPLGAFLCAWGGAAMLVSAPFDDWWHSAYGLDVKVLSPPHVVLILGIVAIRLGTLLLVLGCMNRASGELKRKLDRMFLYVGTLFLGAFIGVFLEFTTRNMMHSTGFYVIVAIVVPLCLVTVARVSTYRWAATSMGAIAMCISLFFLWVLPLFPAEPKLGPVFYKVTHFIPNDFPLLILPAAIVVDLLRRRVASWGSWRQALALGPAFLAVFAACQWPFANFLMSPASRNWVFGTHYIPFFVPPESDYASHVFTEPLQSAGSIVVAMAMAAAVAVLSARAGLGWGDWMRRLQRG